MAGAIETLGSLDAAVGLPYANSLPTYWCLWAPLDTAEISLPRRTLPCLKLERVSEPQRDRNNLP